MSLIIEFDRQQLSFDTNVDVVRDFMSSTFHHMLVPEVVESAGSLGFFQRGDAFVLESESVHEYRDSPLDELIPLVKDEVRLQFMRARPDLLWMHAGAVARSGRAVLLAGTSGQGKSTLTTRLCELGWQFLSDDVSPLRMTENRVVPFPQTPVRRLGSGVEITRENLSRLSRETVMMPASSLCAAEPAIDTIGFLRYRHGSEVSMHELDRGQAALELLRNATNFFDHGAAAVARAVQLAGTVPMFRLEYGDGRSAAGLLSSRLGERM